VVGRSEDMSPAYPLGYVRLAIGQWLEWPLRTIRTIRALNAANRVSCSGRLLRFLSVAAVGSGALLRSALVAPGGVVSCCGRSPAADGFGTLVDPFAMSITPG